MRLILRAGAVVVLALTCAQPAERWIRIKSANFEVLTPGSEKKGRDILLSFERVRGLLANMLIGSATASSAVRVIAFTSERQYRPYAPNEASAAFYQQYQGRDTIVMGDFDSETHPVAVHEYMHLLIQHEGLKLPVWMNEGLAEVYSTIRPRDDQLILGEVIGPHYRILQMGGRWLPLAEVLRAGHDSPLYNEWDRAGVFYAESWALTHMLMLDDRYRSRAGELLRAVHGGVSSEAAFRTVYAKSVPEVESDLLDYIRRSILKAALLPIKLAQSAVQPEVAPMEPFDVRLASASLLEPRKPQQAQQLYAALAREFPQCPEPPEALGFLALRGNRADALPYFERAAALGSSNAAVYWSYAVLLQQVPDSDARMMPVLEKLLSLQPSHADARLMLADRMIRRNQYRQALEQLRAVKGVSGNRAVHQLRQLAFVAYQLDELDEAAAAATRMRQISSLPREIDEAERILEAVSAKRQPPAITVPAARGGGTVPAVAPEPSPQKLPPIEGPDLPRPLNLSETGTLAQVDCLGKQARLVVLVNNARRAFLIERPDMVTIRKTEAAVVEFTCGPQKARRIVVEFLPEVNRELGTVGLVRVLEFPD